MKRINIKNFKIVNVLDFLFEVKVDVLVILEMVKIDNFVLKMEDIFDIEEKILMSNLSSKKEELKTIRG